MAIAIIAINAIIAIIAIIATTISVPTTPAPCVEPDLAGEDGGGGEQDHHPPEHRVVPVAELRVCPREPVVHLVAQGRGERLGRAEGQGDVNHLGQRDGGTDFYNARN